MTELTTSEVNALLEPVYKRLWSEESSFLFIANCREKGEHETDGFTVGGGRIADIIADSMVNDPRFAQTVRDAMQLYLAHRLGNILL